ncbi:Mitochondrial import inner membrane translocase subunit TIM8, partial [Cucurbita argyrosperma subsp. argyrosperma]
MDSSSLNSPELMNFINEEKQRAMVAEMVAKLTSVCWTKCVTGTPGSKFSSSESNCLSNCAQRYMDMSIIIMKRFQNRMKVHIILVASKDILHWPFHFGSNLPQIPTISASNCYDNDRLEFDL